MAEATSSTPINYVEFAAQDLKATVQFFEQAFGWQFTWFGDTYVAFSGAGLDGGFYQATLSSKSAQGGALIVLYQDALEDCVERVVAMGGVITREIFAFPGGRRFQFEEPSGNELAVWSHKDAEGETVPL